MYTMYSAAFAPHITRIGVGPRTELADSLMVNTLGREDVAEVLAFLAQRPIHSVFLAGFILDNGLVSPLNRGTFYGCRDRQGRLEGVALIGHFTLVETRSDRALAAFARLTQVCPTAHLILGEEDKVEHFWNCFEKESRRPRRVSRQVLFTLRTPIELLEPVAGLREATPNDLPRILPVFAEMVVAESGVNPLEVDATGFHQRWLRRVEQHRVWLWTENGRLIFSASIVSEAARVSYLEGIYVAPEMRGRGFGSRCLAQLSHHLLKRADTLCLFTNEQNAPAQVFYHKAGFEPDCYYDTIFLHPKN